MAKSETKRELLMQLHNDVAKLHIQSMGTKEELIAQRMLELTYCLLYLKSQNREENTIKKLGFYLQKLALGIGAFNLYKKIGLILEKF